MLQSPRSPQADRPEEKRRNLTSVAGKRQDFSEVLQAPAAPCKKGVEGGVGGGAAPDTSFHTQKAGVQRAQCLCWRSHGYVMTTFEKPWGKDRRFVLGKRFCYYGGGTAVMYDLTIPISQFAEVEGIFYESAWKTSAGDGVRLTGLGYGGGTLCSAAGRDSARHRYETGESAGSQCCSPARIAHRIYPGRAPG